MPHVITFTELNFILRKTDLRRTQAEPGRTNSLATAGSNFTKPGAQNKVDPCTQSSRCDASSTYPSSAALCRDSRVLNIYNSNDSKRFFALITNNYASYLQCTGCFIPSVNLLTISLSRIHDPILKSFNVVIVHMVRFDIMYGNLW